MGTRCKVVIIGAGAAGLAAADRLHRAGVRDFVVLEAGDRVGGRVWSSKVSEGGGLVEFGAQWIHGEEGNVVYDIASQFGQLPEGDSGSISDADATFLWEDGSRLEDELVEQMMMIFSSIEESLEKESPSSLSRYPNLGQYYTTALQTQLGERGLSDDQELCAVAGSYLQWYGRLQASIDGAPTWNMTAVDQNLQYRECEGEQTVTLARGNTYQGLLERMGENIMDRVQLEERVTKLRHGKHLQEVEVHTTKAVYQCEFVVVTLSLGVLKAEGEMFDPPLPEKKMEVMNKMGFGTIAKIFIEFPVELAKVLPDIKPAGFNFLRRAEGLSALENTPSTPWLDGVFGLYPDQSDPHLLVAWLTGPAAMQVETLPPAQVLAGISGLISATLLPSIPALPLPISTRVTTWGGNPLTRGSYSYLTPSTPPNSPAILAEPVGRVLWAGEATHSMYFSTVHGAVESGRREADRVLNWKE